MAFDQELLHNKFAQFIRMPRINQQLCNINDSFERVIDILVNYHIAKGILTGIARAILVKIAVVMLINYGNKLIKSNKYIMVDIIRLNPLVPLKGISEVCVGDIYRGDIFAN